MLCALDKHTAKYRPQQMTISCFSHYTHTCRQHMHTAVLCDNTVDTAAAIQPKSVTFYCVHTPSFTTNKKVNNPLSTV